MPTFDAAGQAALGAPVVRPIYFAFLDFDGSPIRVTTASANVAFAGTGDPDLDGYTFDAIDARFVSVGDVLNQTGGSDTLTLQLSGLPEIDAATLAILNDRSKWRLRYARLWVRIHDEAGAQQGVVAGYYTGQMMAADIVPTPKGQTIEIRVENYLALLSEPSDRTYLNQSYYDPADKSAKATIGAATGATTGPGGSAGQVGGFGRAALRMVRSL